MTLLTTRHNHYNPWSVDRDAMASAKANAGCDNYDHMFARPARVRYVTQSGSRTGGDNPGWKSRVRLHEEATSAMDLTKYTELITEGSATSRYSWPCGPGNSRTYRTTSGSGCLQSVSPGVSSTFDKQALQAQAINAATHKWLSKYQSSHAQGLVMLGELRVTVRMLRHPYEGVRDGIKKYVDDVYRQRKVLGPKRQAAHALTDMWLETVYGVNPFLSDVATIAEQVAKIRLRESSFRIHVTGRAEDAKVLAPVFDSPGLYGPYGPFVRQQQTVYRCKASCRISSGFHQNFGPDLTSTEVLSRAGVTLGDFVPALWELIPYSFVVDYFTNLGDIIGQSFTVFTGLSYSCSSVTMENEGRTTSAWGDPRTIGAPYTTQYQYEGSGDFGSHVNTEVTYGRTLGIRSPTFELSLPGYRQFANLVSLTGNKLSGDARKLEKSFGRKPI